MQRITPQFVMIVQVLVAQNQAIDPLANEAVHAVFDEALVSSINKTFRELSQKAEWLDMMFEFLGALGPAMNENNRTTASLPYIAQLDAIGCDEGSSGEIAHEENSFGPLKSTIVNRPARRSNLGVRVQWASGPRWHPTRDADTVRHVAIR